MSKIVSKELKSLSVPLIKEKKNKNEKIVMVTAYDYPSAKLCDESGVDIILVGDSLGMVVQGNEDTLSVTISEMIYHTKIVSKAVKMALVVTDMPFLSYHTGAKEAITNCGKCIKYGGAQAVKIEGGKKRSDLIKRIVDNEIPVMGHIGLTPQSIHKLGGFKVQGRDKASIDMLIEDSISLEKANVFAIVLECIPSEVAKIITETVKVPTIGIGSGPYCDGQVLVFHDLLGITEPPLPRFVKTYKNLRSEIKDGISSFALEVRKGVFPSEEMAYHIDLENQKENIK